MERGKAATEAVTEKHAEREAARLRIPRFIPSLRHPASREGPQSTVPDPQSAVSWVLVAVGAGEGRGVKAGEGTGGSVGFAGRMPSPRGGAGLGLGLGLRLKLGLGGS